MQRKIFRIEQGLPLRPDASGPSPAGVPGEQRAALVALLAGDNQVSLRRAAGELRAAVAGMEEAAHTIIRSAEGIGDCTRKIPDSAPARAIGLHVTTIYESCHFQDLAGQRIAKVIALLNALEENLGAMLEGHTATSAPHAAPPLKSLLNGPKLDGDSGHVTQIEIDRLFA